jgi:hypothetical protein
VTPQLGGSLPEFALLCSRPSSTLKFRVENAEWDGAGAESSSAAPGASRPWPKFSAKGNFMLRAAVFIALASLAATGCSMCAHPFDCAYPAYGGKWQRYDQFNGRVGSRFAPQEETVYTEGSSHPAQAAGVGTGAFVVEEFR